MLEVPDIHAIRTLMQRGMSKRQIAKTLGISRTTVDKYTAPDYVVEPRPRMRLRKARPAPRLDPWKPVIASWVAADEAAPPKQRRSARKMYKDLRQHYRADVSEATVRRYVAVCKQQRAKKAYVPLDFPPGDMIQVDFGRIKARLGGVEQTLFFIAMRLMFSSASFVKAYPHMKLEAWLDGICCGLSFFGGVTAKLMLDNDSAIVREILDGGRRLQTPEFRALVAHYGCEAVFANPGAGNEKGGVEKLVQWAERNLFSPVPEEATLEALNAKLAEQCLEDARTRRRSPAGPLAADLWEQEQGHLAPLPGVSFPACRKRLARVDKTLLVTYAGARYSVPPAYAGKALTLRAYWDRIELADGERTVAEHARQAAGGTSLHLEHYLPVLAHKPRAVAHAAVIARGEPAIARYRDAFLAARQGAHRELVAILRLAEATGVAGLAQALETATRHRAFDLESVRAILAMGDGSAATPAALEEAWLRRWPKTDMPDVRSEAYGWLLQVAAGGEPQ